ncbi:PREDICTED: R3H and coiled-coil domain-containing protein 1 isoform X2 [Dufourea novaeangliae]|uniref:R3H and coiled-coil domain-containing protein 1 isoform X2 n=1 Tax=Dufourea novaeangliae TaxID=178035 RepID=UPI000767428D|nr:PREDICTED: R3H and coiled-coil domain-containing protein 1 isoform X2 [Dufourea novaeangliae]
MSLQDSLFSQDVEHDVTLFSRDKRRKRVLVFPPVNNYRRFIIHQFVQDRFDDLHTFSIGQGVDRRTVVCFKSDLIRDPKLNGVQCKSSPKVADSLHEMGVEGQRSPSASPERVRVQRPAKVVPAVEIYRPPAARRARNEQTVTEQVQAQPTIDSPSNVKTTRQKRPDRAVYVPRARRSLETEGSPQPSESARANRTAKDALTSSSSHGQPKSNSNLKEIESDSRQSAECVKKLSNTCSDKYQNHPESEISQCLRVDSKNTTTSGPSVVSVAEVCNEVKCEQLNNTSEDVPNKSNESAVPDAECERTGVFQPQTVKEDEMSSNSSEDKTSLDSVEACVDNEVNVDKDLERSDKYKDDVVAISTTNNNKTNEKFSYVVQKDTPPVKEVTPTPITPPEKKVKKIERQKSKPASPPSPPIKKINRDECDWDSLFDDNGDCLDPTLIEELTSAVGDVMIEQPKNDYKSYTRHIEVSSDEYAHVLEIYNFPSEFKTSDLAAVFSPFKNGGFELKWVDDTHCLGVFSSPLVAAEVLASDHAFVKTRPLSEATALSKTKARRSAEFLQPYRSRPETCAALARRLVTGALGVKLATARQEREHEKNILREAKEKRRLANKQRDDVWEGIIPEK